MKNEKKRISIKFESNVTIYIELDSSLSPNTVKSTLDSLPLEVKINRWVDELYTDRTSIVAIDENPKSEVNLLDVAYWPEGNALCLFYGPTPISKSSDKILPYSPVNIIGKIISKENILDKVKEGSKIIVEIE